MMAGSLESKIFPEIKVFTLEKNLALNFPHTVLKWQPHLSRMGRPGGLHHTNPKALQYSSSRDLCADIQEPCKRAKPLQSCSFAHCNPWLWPLGSLWLIQVLSDRVLRWFTVIILQDHPTQRSSHMSPILAEAGSLLTFASRNSLSSSFSSPKMRMIIPGMFKINNLLQLQGWWPRGMDPGFVQSHKQLWQEVTV